MTAKGRTHRHLRKGGLLPFAAPLFKGPGCASKRTLQSLAKRPIADRRLSPIVAVKLLQTGRLCAAQQDCVPQIAERLASDEDALNAKVLCLNK